MNITRLNPMLETQNLSKAIAWYRDVLGFELQDHLPDLGWASMVRGEVRLMLVTRLSRDKHPHPVCTGSYYFYTDEVDQWWSHLKDKADVEYPLENYSYGMREFAVRDLNGYLLQFGTYIEE